MGETAVTPTGLAARSGATAAARQREAFDNPAEKALTFAEGIVDALSFGLLHETGDLAAIRRDVNSGPALFGQLTGFVAGMGVGPVSKVAAGGKALGEKAAAAVLKDVSAGTRGAIAAKTAGGATEMAGLMAAGAVGHQVTDAILDDKEFSGAAVLHEAGMSALMGGGFSFLSGVFGRAASRSQVKSQGGLLDAASPESRGLVDHVSTARKGWDDALEVHEQRFGALRVLEREGISELNTVPEFMAKRELAVAEARAARSTLDALDFEAAMAGKPREYAKWHNAMEHYQERVGHLDDLMTRSHLERMTPQAPGAAPSYRPKVVEPGKPSDVPGGHGVNPTQAAAEGGPGRTAFELDDLMRRDPALLPAYERLHGRPYEFIPNPPGSNLGGVATETSELVSRAGTPRAMRGEAPAGPTPTEASAAAWAPSSPPGRFNASEFSPNTLAGEGVGARLVDRELAAMPGGNFMPAADIRQNAEAFAQFRQRAATGQGAVPAPGTPVPIPGTSTTQVIGRGKPAEQPVVPVGSSKPTQVIERQPRLQDPYATTRVIDRAGPAAPAKPSAAQVEGKAAVRRYLDEWSAASDRLGPRHSPGDVAAQEIRRTVEAIRGAAGGREVSAAATDIGTHLKLPPSRSALGAELNGIYAMRQLANVAADASKGTVMGGGTRNRFIDWITRRSVGRMGAMIGGAVIGNQVGGPVGYFAGAALAYKYIGFGGRAAGAAGRLYTKAVAAGAVLLGGKRSVYAARATLGNRTEGTDVPTYSERGPIKDPVERIQELQRVAQTPATVAEYVARAAGDLNIVAPEFVAATAAVATAQLTFLLSKAPPVEYDRLGRPIRPSSGSVRQFVEAERAVFNLDDILDSVARGRVSRIQVEALQQAHGPVYTKMAAFLLSDPEKLAALERSKLRTIEMVVGIPLTSASDPMFIARQQMGWGPEQMPGEGMPGAGPAQALKIPGTGGPPSDRAGAAYGSTPTPSQSYGTSGRAPGN
jgi:hypothetical protein